MSHAGRELGYGVGDRHPIDVPNLLRLIVGKMEDDEEVSEPHKIPPRQNIR
jgi:uncharacterized protein (DUF111 family)